MMLYILFDIASIPTASHHKIKIPTMIGISPEKNATVPTPRIIIIPIAAMKKPIFAHIIFAVLEINS